MVKIIDKSNNILFHDLIIKAFERLKFQDFSFVSEDAKSITLQEVFGGFYINEYNIGNSLDFLTVFDVIPILLNILFPHDFCKLQIVKLGQSKEIRKLSDKIVIIKYIDSISSHTNNKFGNIAGSDIIRIEINDKIQKMLNLENIRTAYLGMIKTNDSVFVYEEYIEAPPIECIIKAKVVGTPLHTYYDLTKSKTRYGKYLEPEGNWGDSKFIIRFDWRNPARAPFTLNLKESELLDEELLGHLESQDGEKYKIKNGEEKYFKQKLTLKINDAIENNDVKRYQLYSRLNTLHFLPDQALPDELADIFIDTKEAKKTLKRVFCVMQDILSPSKLELWDICLTLDYSGGILFGEISPDCMRLKKISESGKYDDFDKDIWRKSDIKDSFSVLLERWQFVNGLLSERLKRDSFSSKNIVASGNSIEIIKSENGFTQIFKPTIFIGKYNQVIKFESLNEIRCKLTYIFSEILSSNGLRTAFGKILDKDSLEVTYVDASPVEVVLKTRYNGSHRRKYNFANSMDKANFDRVCKSYPDILVEFHYRNIFPEEDMPMSDDLASLFIDVQNAKYNSRKAFYLLQNFMSSIRYTLEDICFFMDRTGSIFIGEISVDNSRISEFGGKYLQEGKEYLIDDEYKQIYLSRMKKFLFEVEKEWLLCGGSGL